MFKDLIQEVIWSLMGNKVRSGLTILGIVIGIASVITMVGIGQGSKKSIETQIESIGSNLIMIMPGSQSVGGVRQSSGSAQTLTEEDVSAIKDKVDNIKAIAPSVTGNYQITAKNNNTRTQVIGTTDDYAMVKNVTLDSGLFFSENQVRSSAKVAVIGPDTSESLFGTEANPVGQTIRINNVIFQVIGVTTAKGGSGFNNQDDVVYVPMKTSQNYLAGNDYISNINITVETQDAMTQAQEDIQAVLLETHKIASTDDADFRIMNQNEIISTASSITGTITILLSSIAGISLLVGGIGIMNMMLTTVTERTREIGLRKAVGVRKFYINMQFLAEAITLTFIGGVTGVILGFVASYLLTVFFSLSSSISLSSVLLSFGVSAAVGIIFGFYPARRAANLSPIEALRYE
ncbi:MAG: ABC transporter, permease protein [Candidatus Moranbacteria bacterium GW2011_GWE1_35_17]|nr:MAG: ABC transporter, permease protein [Candidatus Moranbacteria bacterium GW2011_GWE1_35_17]KKP73487.1 MAG: ABC transporter, permease protein [Candidatus Moranbacteria bacterium GW2011_GWE2_35_164]KKP85225.1 MAG: ABC transporter, permease protein [Candidatus Moranbacteria bacterium GW2011_GWF2_35_54]